ILGTQEREFIRSGGRGQFGKPFTGIRYEEDGFESQPYLGFGYSHDVYANGSIVVVRAPGPTPGGVLIFVTRPTGTPYTFGGDLVWQLEGITEREERPCARGDHRTGTRSASFRRDADSVFRKLTVGFIVYASIPTRRSAG